MLNLRICHGYWPVWPNLIPMNGPPQFAILATELQYRFSIVVVVNQNILNLRYLYAFFYFVYNHSELICILCFLLPFTILI